LESHQRQLVDRSDPLNQLLSRGDLKHPPTAVGGIQSVGR
jgi:hypothetical protein